MLLDKKEFYYGYLGMVKCFCEGGDVGFFYIYDVMENFEEFFKEFDILCRNKKFFLELKNIYK